MHTSENIIAHLIDADYSDKVAQDASISWFVRMTETCFRSLSLGHPEKFINRVILVDTLVHLQVDLRRLPSPNEYKVGGYLCFWIKKLKPFRFHKPFRHYTNEMLAVAIGLSVVASNNSYGSKSLPAEVFENICFDLRYRPVSPSVIANQFHMLYL